MSGDNREFYQNKINSIEAQIAEKQEKVDKLREAYRAAYDRLDDVAGKEDEVDVKKAKRSLARAKEDYERAEAALPGILEKLDREKEDYRKDLRALDTPQEAVTKLEARMQRVDHTVERIDSENRKRKLGEFSELDTMDGSEYNTHDVTGGTLTDKDLKVAHYSIHGRFKDWQPSVNVDDLYEAVLGAKEHGFPDFLGLFDCVRDGLHVVDIQSSQQWGLAASASFLDHHQRTIRCNWSSARPDFLVLPGKCSAVNSRTAPNDVLKSSAPIVFVEVQSGGKHDKYGMMHLRMALVGAHKAHPRVYYGLFIRKGTKYLGEAQLHKIDGDGAVHIDSDYRIATVPALCKWLMEWSP